jgi:hypothetical protein
MIGEHELTLVISAPQIIGLIGSREAAAFGLEVMTSPAAADQAVSIQYRVHGAYGWQTDSQA